MPYKRNPGIYAIRCVETNKVYVGSSVRLHGRWVDHRKHLTENRHGNDYLQNAWNKYGEASFTFEVLETVEDVSTLLEREQHHIDRLSAADREHGYNLTPTAGSNLGKKFSPEFCRKTSERLKGNRYAAGSVRTAEHMKAITDATRGNTYVLGRKHDDETKLKISNASKGRKLTEEHRKKISEAKRRNKGLQRFTADKVAEIRQRIAEGERFNALAIAFGCCQQTIANVHYARCGYEIVDTS